MDSIFVISIDHQLQTKNFQFKEWWARTCLSTPKCTPRGRRPCPPAKWTRDRKSRWKSSRPSSRGKFGRQRPWSCLVRKRRLSPLLRAVAALSWAVPSRPSQPPRSSRSSCWRCGMDWPACFPCFGNAVSKPRFFCFVMFRTIFLMCLSVRPSVCLSVCDIYIN